MPEPRDQPSSFDDGLDQLETLVQKLEGGSLGLEEALSVFETGVKLSQQLQAQLAEAQRRVEVLKSSLDGGYRVEPLDEAP
ncbi:MAG TPA: exodeoxyribonuclease VII small subunit [Holophagaceae bacterium]|jgi:exodeoxyribonuclease VII small subunit|nr:exodeoxyribonuclease VII small subunit [Holophagaceae bacterium]